MSNKLAKYLDYIEKEKVMKDLKVYEKYAIGNVDKMEIVPIRIYTHETIDEITIKQINQMRCCDVQRLGKIKKWQVLRADD